MPPRKQKPRQKQKQSQKQSVIVNIGKEKKPRKRKPRKKAGELPPAPPVVLGLPKTPPIVVQYTQPASLEGPPPVQQPAAPQPAIAAPQQGPRFEQPVRQPLIAPAERERAAARRQPSISSLTLESEGFKQPATISSPPVSPLTVSEGFKSEVPSARSSLFQPIRSGSDILRPAPPAFVELVAEARPVEQPAEALNVQAEVGAVAKTPIKITSQQPSEISFVEPEPLQRATSEATSARRKRKYPNKSTLIRQIVRATPEFTVEELTKMELKYVRGIYDNYYPRLDIAEFEKV